MKKISDEIFLYQIAKNYYIDNMSQTKIAEKENISKPQICRFLKKAKEVGIVDIRVVLPNKSNESITNSVQSKLKLDHVVIVPTEECSPENQKIANVATVAANYISTQIEGSKYIGTGWGETLYNTAKNLSFQKPNKDLTFAPIVGSAGTNKPFLQPNSIMERFAEKYGGETYYNHSCVLMEEISQAEQVRLEDLKKIWDKLDMVIFEIGNGFEKKEDLEELPIECQTEDMKKNAMGNIASNIFNKDGSLYTFPSRYQHIRLPLERFKEIEHVICISYGEDKVDSIKFAAENGYIKTLITDSITAEALLKD